jgi:hypothetical protein
MEGYGLSSLGPTVGLSGLPDPMGDATAALEARRRQQVTNAGYPGAAADATNPFEGILSALGPTINERAVAAREAMRRGDMATANALNQSLALDFGQFLGSIKPIRAYHGSPHDFDRFSMDKIGTGEGGQAFGHGLYFAENEGVARSYRDTLSDILVGGKKLDYSTPLSAAEDAAVWAHMEGSRDAAIRRIESTTHHLQNSRHKDIPEFRALEYLRSGAPLPDVKPTGRMYEVDIHADPGRMLDLDSPLSKQAPEVRDAAMKAIARGAEDMARAQGISGADVAAGVAGSANPISMFPNAYKGASMSNALREAGIPGVRYFDAASRTPGVGTRNYVVFDDKLIEILRKYGIMAPVAGAGLSALPLGDEEGM